jgi:signal transduction histidine kinase
MHSLLARQLRRHFERPELIPPELEPFIAAIDEAYGAFDDDRQMLERSLELSSDELLQANSEMRALLASFPDLVARLDRENVLLDFKGGAGLGLTRLDHPVGQPLEAAFAPEIAGPLAESAAHALSSREPIHREVRKERAGGESVYEARLVPYQRDEVLVLLRDVTERAHAEEATQRAASALRATLEATADGIVVVDGHDRITEYNRRFCDMWDIAPEVLDRGEDLPVRRAVFGALKDPDGFAARVDELRGDSTRTGEGTVERRDGRTFDWYAQARSAGGECGGRVWSFRDVTQHHVLEGQLRQAQKMEAVGRLAGGIAHDFNNILVVILGYGEAIAEELGDDHDVSAMAQEMIKAGNRGADLTRQLLALSRKQVVRLASVNVPEAVSGIVPMLERLVGEDVKLVSEVRTDAAFVMADRGQLEQVILNLAVNARDAMSRGGELHILTDCISFEAGQVPPGTDLPPGEYVRISVTDTGEGMSDEVKARIFDPFFTTKPADSGTGLGLSIVYGVVREYKGHLVVESELGVGSTFHVYLPRAAEVAAQRPVAVGTSANVGGSETVLVIEDEDAVRGLVSRTLSGAGYAVMAAPSGEDAIRAAHDYTGVIDIIVADTVLPGISGREAATQICEQRPDSRLLFMSGYTPDEILRKGISAGELDLLQKPFSGAELLTRVRRKLDQ